MVERDDDHFDLDDDFVAESDEEQSYEKFIDQVADEPAPAPPPRRKKARPPGANSRTCWPTGA